LFSSLLLLLFSSSPASLHSYAWAVPHGIQPFFKAIRTISTRCELVRCQTRQLAAGNRSESPCAGPLDVLYECRHGTNSRASFIRQTCLYPAGARSTISQSPFVHCTA
jgi:hypothetical protein